MALRDTLRFHRALFATNLKASLANRGAFAMSVGLMIVNDAIWFAVWAVFFGRFRSIGGFGLEDMALLQGVLASAFGLGVVFAAGTRDLAKTISEGDLDTFLLQPKPALAHVIASKTTASGLGDLVYGLAMLATFARLNATSWPWVPVGLVAGAVVVVSFGVVVHSVAFWAGPVHTLARQMNEILVIFTGYPDLLFGGMLRVALFTLVPAGFVAWMPARLVREPSLVSLSAVLGGALATAALAVFVFRRGLRRYESGSRFGSMG